MPIISDAIQKCNTFLPSFSNFFAFFSRSLPCNSPFFGAFGFLQWQRSRVCRITVFEQIIRSSFFPTQRIFHTKKRAASSPPRLSCACPLSPHRILLPASRKRRYGKREQGGSLPPCTPAQGPVALDPHPREKLSWKTKLCARVTLKTRVCRLRARAEEPPLPDASHPGKSQGNLSGRKHAFSRTVCPGFSSCP